MSFFNSWFDNLFDRFNEENDRNRREDRDVETTVVEETGAVIEDRGRAGGAGEIFFPGGNTRPTEPTEPTRPTPTDPTETTITESTANLTEGLKITKVNLLGKANAAVHNCDKYELVTRGKGACVIRRGGAFKLSIELNQVPNLKQQKIKLFFGFGASPNMQKGTQAILEVTIKKNFSKNHEEWDVRQEEVKDNTLTLEVQVPTHVPVGVWNLTVEAAPRNEPSARHLLRIETLFYILFNPWNKHDQVYMENEENRQEYVLNDVGKIWVGSYYSSHGREWVYGQFDDAVLPACVILLEQAGVKPSQRGDPIIVTRAISRIVNANDDRGVLIGRWDNNYDDGTAPSRWTGSIRILETFMRRRRPVKYGQCWVFAGVVNTVCRALGVPCRVVSNFNSAHDTDKSLSIDRYIDEEGDKIEPDPWGHDPSGLADSIWNFHVWNDAWMARPDLPKGYGGWQAIDATPQEASAGVYQLGPASHEAIRRGHVQFNYDVPFVVAEVNADIVNWQRDVNDPEMYKKISSNTRRVGYHLLTKKPGRMSSRFYDESDREDCTSEYKPAEGTDAERAVLYNAVRMLRPARHAYRFPSEAIEDVDFSLKDMDKFNAGESFRVEMTMKNTSSEDRTVRVVLSVASQFYTGVRAYAIKKSDGKYIVKPGATETVTMLVNHTEYFDKLVEHGMMQSLAVANVKETTQAWSSDDCFQIEKPVIDIQLTKKDVKVGEGVVVIFSFTNPLPITLRNCILVIDGPGLTRPKEIPLENISPESKWSYSYKLYAKKAGSRTIVATFNSIQLSNLTGSVSLEVIE